MTVGATPPAPEGRKTLAHGVSRGTSAEIPLPHSSVSVAPEGRKNRPPSQRNPTHRTPNHSYAPPGLGQEWIGDTAPSRPHGLRRGLSSFAPPGLGNDISSAAAPARIDCPYDSQRGVYAIAVDLDIESLRRAYGDPYNNAYAEIRNVLKRHGFAWQQGSVYFGDDRINAVTCVLAAIDLSRSLPWFAASVRDIRMLRIEELNDLMPAVQQL
jgi:virulence-associated protein VapD